MKKKALTLLEIMIVIFLITLITGAIGYNMLGTLEKGKVFRTEQAQEQLHDLLLVCLNEGWTVDAIIQNPVQCLTRSGLAKNPNELIVDGWGEAFTITPLRNRKDFKIESRRLTNYRNRMNRVSETSESTEEE